MDGMTDKAESIGITGARGCWAYKRLSVWRVKSWSKEQGLRVVVGMRTGAGKGLPTECPTTRFGRTSSGGPWGHQLLVGTPQASRRVWTAVTTKQLLPACG